MPLPAVAAGAATALPYVLQFLSSPLGQQILQQGGGYVGRKLFGGQQPGQDPFSQQQMQSERDLLTGLSTPYQFDFEPIRRSSLRDFNEQQVPALQTAFGGVGGDSGWYNQALAGARAGLEDRLAGLQASTGLQSQSLNQARQNALMNYLSGQKDLARRQFEFGKTYPSQLFGQGMQAVGMGADYRDRNRPLGEYQRTFGAATGQPQQNVYTPGKTGLFGPAVNVGADLLGRYAGTKMGL